MNARIDPPSSAQLVAHAVQELSRRTGFPVAFGGLLRDGEVAVTAIHGARTRSLEGLKVQSDRGLGGKAVVELRPRMTQDYGASRVITHDYDNAVLGEGITTLLAVPVIVDGVARAVLYGGAWSSTPVGEVTTGPAFQVAERLAMELRLRDEVDRRVALLSTTPITVPLPTPLSAAQREEVRASYTELRLIGAELGDAAIRDRLVAIEQRLAALVGDAAAAIEPLDVRLSPREVDVLACAALGGTTAAIAEQLGLKPGTVKAYLATAMSKLGVSTRHAAVARARRAGVLP